MLPPHEDAYDGVVAARISRHSPSERASSHALHLRQHTRRGRADSELSRFTTDMAGRRETGTYYGGQRSIRQGSHAFTATITAPPHSRRWLRHAPLAPSPASIYRAASMVGLQSAFYFAAHFMKVAAFSPSLPEITISSRRISYVMTECLLLHISGRSALLRNLMQPFCFTFCRFIAQSFHWPGASCICKCRIRQV